MKLAPDDFATHVELGRVLLDSDDNAGALREFQMAVHLAPASPESHYDLASAAYAKLGRKEDAAREREEFRRLRKVRPIRTSRSGGAACAGARQIVARFGVIRL